HVRGAPLPVSLVPQNPRAKNARSRACPYLAFTTRGRSGNGGFAMIAYTPTVLTAEGIIFPEGPRCHAGKLWFSDIHGARVMTVDPKGHLEPVVEVPTRPSGLGFDPRGRLLVLAMRDRRFLRFENGGRGTVARMDRLMS